MRDLSRALGRLLGSGYHYQLTKRGAGSGDRRLINTPEGSRDANEAVQGL
jgi:hypothetical protein